MGGIGGEGLGDRGLEESEGRGGVKALNPPEASQTKGRKGRRVSGNLEVGTAPGKEERNRERKANKMVSYCAVLQLLPPKSGV